MTLLRTDTQVTLHDLCVLAKTSLDFYERALPELQDEASTALVKQCMLRRQTLVDSIEAEIRAEKDLPPEPDSEREAGQQIVEKVRLAAADKPERELLAFRLSQERLIEDQLQSMPTDQLSGPCEALRDKFLTDVHDTIAAIQDRIDLL